MKYIIKPHTEHSWKINILNDNNRSILTDYEISQEYQTIIECKRAILHLIQKYNIPTDKIYYEYFVLKYSSGFKWKPCRLNKFKIQQILLLKKKAQLKKEHNLL